MKVWFGIEEATDGSGGACSVGHTKSYVKVLVPRDDSLPGRCRMVNIHSCARFHVEGTVDISQDDLPVNKGWRGSVLCSSWAAWQ